MAVIARRSVLVVLTALSFCAAPAAYLAQSNGPPGRVAYIGSDYNVYTTAVGDDAPRQLTFDASRENSATRLYQWPTWSNDGRLAYFAGTFEEGIIGGTEVIISPDGQQAGISAHFFDGDAFTYAYWSPANCVIDAQCRDLAVLMSRPSSRGFVVELVRDLEEQDEPVLAGEGAPFYFSWSSDGTRMFWHRNNGQLDLYDVVGNAIVATLDEIPGWFAAPAWSPVDDQVLFLGTTPGGSRSSLVISEDGAVSPLISGLEGPAAFSWSPDGDRIAYVDNHGALIVADGQHGQEIVRSSEENVIAFFWSPDGTKLAFLTPVIEDRDLFSAKSTSALTAKRQDTVIGIAWSVLFIEGGIEQQFDSFLPTSELMYFLTYFDQFAQSHHLWSPDSRYLVYAENRDRRAVISLLDTTQFFNPPQIIADGSMGIWSFQ